MEFGALVTSSQPTTHSHTLSPCIHRALIRPSRCTPLFILQADEALKKTVILARHKLEDAKYQSEHPPDHTQAGQVHSPSHSPDHSPGDSPGLLVSPVKMTDSPIVGGAATAQPFADDAAGGSPLSAAMGPVEMDGAARVDTLGTVGAKAGGESGRESPSEGGFVPTMTMQAEWFKTVSGQNPTSHTRKWARNAVRDKRGDNPAALMPTRRGMGKYDPLGISTRTVKLEDSLMGECLLTRFAVLVSRT